MIKTNLKLNKLDQDELVGKNTDELREYAIRFNEEQAELLRLRKEEQVKAQTEIIEDTEEKE